MATKQDVMWDRFVRAMVQDLEDANVYKTRTLETFSDKYVDQAEEIAHGVNRQVYFQDPSYALFHKRLYSEKWNFQQVVQITCLNDWSPKNNTKQWLKQVEEHWIVLATQWQREEDELNKPSEEKAVRESGELAHQPPCDPSESKEKVENPIAAQGYAALTLLYASIDYQGYSKEELAQYFNVFEGDMINKVYYYNRNRSQLSFKKITDLNQTGPNVPIDYEDWLKHKYEVAAFWVVYRIHEKQQKLPSLFDSICNRLSFRE